MKKNLSSLKISTNKIIPRNDSKIKIIDNFKCYITCLSKTNEALNSNVGDNIKLRLPNSEEVPAKIVYKNNESKDEVLLVFEIEQSVESLINYRKVAIDIIWWSDSGIKVPNKAIKYDGDFAYVTRNSAGYEEKILIKVLRQNDNYSIVENYSTQELEEEGYNASALDNKKSLRIYDEIVMKKR